MSESTLASALLRAKEKLRRQLEEDGLEDMAEQAIDTQARNQRHGAAAAVVWMRGPQRRRDPAVGLFVRGMPCGVLRAQSGSV